VTRFLLHCQLLKAVKRMTRPTGVTIIAILTFLGAVLLGFGAFIFLFVGVMGMMGGDAGQPFSVAIAAMGTAGGFSLLILAGVAGCTASGVLKLREWARIVSIIAIAAGVVCTIFSLFTSMGYLFVPPVPTILCHLLVVAAAMWMLGYLLRPNVKKAFSAATSRVLTSA
jgi:hypothetical protein